MDTDARLTDDNVASVEVSVTIIQCQSTLLAENDLEMAHSSCCLLCLLYLYRNIVPVHKYVKYTCIHI